VCSSHYLPSLECVHPIICPHSSVFIPLIRRMDGYAFTILTECNQPVRLDVLLTTRLVSLALFSIGLSSTLTAFFSLSFPLALLPSLFHSLPLTTPLRAHSLTISLPLSSTHHTTQNSISSTLFHSLPLTTTLKTHSLPLSSTIFQLSSTLFHSPHSTSQAAAESRADRQSREMATKGFRHTSPGGTQRRLSHAQLPPEFDLFKHAQTICCEDYLY
jgi:hypothetical protein